MISRDTLDKLGVAAGTLALIFHLSDCSGNNTKASVSDVLEGGSPTTSLVSSEYNPEGKGLVEKYASKVNNTVNKG